MRENRAARRARQAAAGWPAAPGALRAPGIAPVVVGTALGFLVFEVVARLTAGFHLAISWLITALVALAAVVVVEMVTSRCGPRQALGGLGFGRPPGRALAVGVGISALFLALLPVVSWLTEADFGLTPDWPLLALGVFAMNGVAEEALYRGYLYRHLRQGRSFGRAVALGMVVHAISHLPILPTAGWQVWAAASLVALASFPPLAYLYERGRNTLWAPALVHAAIDSLKLVITAETLISPGGVTATFVWMALSAVLPYLAIVLLRRAAPEPAPPPVLGDPAPRP